MDAQNSNFASKFPKIGLFGPEFCIFSFFEENFLAAQNLGAESNCPLSPATAPLYLCSYVCDTWN